MKVVGIDACSSSVSIRTSADSSLASAQLAAGSEMTPPSRGALGVKGTAVDMAIGDARRHGDRRSTTAAVVAMKAAARHMAIGAPIATVVPGGCCQLFALAEEPTYWSRTAIGRPGPMAPTTLATDVRFTSVGQIAEFYRDYELVEYSVL